jgi:hypothetical protein
MEGESGELGLVRDDPSGMDATVQDAIGYVGMALSVASGVTLTSLVWTLSGPRIYSGTIQVAADARAIRFILGAIEQGSGYVLALTGTDDEGDPCSGTSEPFDVIAGSVTGASVTIRCTRASDAVVAADIWPTTDVFRTADASDSGFAADGGRVSDAFQTSEAVIASDAETKPDVLHAGDAVIASDGESEAEAD